MKRGSGFFLYLLLLSYCFSTTLAAASTDIWLLDIHGPIGPPTADFVVDHIERAQGQAQALILRIDTPGGLDRAMRDINKGILASTIPIIGYVAPQGARAASAGTYILYACHFAAMAPATNLGAATPVSIATPMSSGRDHKQSDDTPPPADAMQKKMINDAVAYIRSLAELRKRDADWAEHAVREAASLSANKALENNVIDAIATDVDQLIQIAGAQPIALEERLISIDASNYQLVVIEADWRQRLLVTITDPNVAYILMLIGIYGLILEFYNPGGLVPGVLGAICLLLALYAFQVLPISYAALGLIALGIGLMIAEAMIPSFGILGMGGIIALAAGSVMLLDSDLPGYQIARPLIIGAVAVSAALCIGIVGFAIRARSRPVVSGIDAMIGMSAEALEDFQHSGRVQVGGEIWQARSSAPVARGSHHRVCRIEGLTVILNEEHES